MKTFLLTTVCVLALCSVPGETAANTKLRCHWIKGDIVTQTCRPNAAQRKARPAAHNPNPNPKPTDPDDPDEPDKPDKPDSPDKDKHPNNGHGNDPDGNDSSNPGHSNNGDGTDNDGSPGHSGDHGGGNGNGNGGKK